MAKKADSSNGVAGKIKPPVKRQFLVTLEMPENVTLNKMAVYIEEAVASWKGKLISSDPMSEFKGSSVKVKSVPLPKKEKK